MIIQTFQVEQAQADQGGWCLTTECRCYTFLVASYFATGRRKLHYNVVLDWKTKITLQRCFRLCLQTQQERESVYLRIFFAVDRGRKRKCVWERYTYCVRDRERETRRRRKRKHISLCVCVCMYACACVRVLQCVSQSVYVSKCVCHTVCITVRVLNQARAK